MLILYQVIEENEVKSREAQVTIELNEEQLLGQGATKNGPKPKIASHW